MVLLEPNRHFTFKMVSIFGDSFVSASYSRSYHTLCLFTEFNWLRKSSHGRLLWAYYKYVPPCCI